MAFAAAERVQETTTTTGTGTLTLDGAVTGFQGFLAAIGSGNECFYLISSSGGSEWEVGVGTVGAGTLTRDRVIESSNSDALVSLSAGTKNVACVYPAQYAMHTANPTDAASNRLAFWEGNPDRGTAADNDESYIQWNLSTSGTDAEFCRITLVGLDITDATEDAQLKIALAKAGSVDSIIELDWTSGVVINTDFTVTAEATDAYMATFQQSRSAADNLVRLRNTANGNTANRVGFEARLKNSSNTEIKAGGLLFQLTTLTAGSEVGRVDLECETASGVIVCMRFQGGAARFPGGVIIGSTSTAPTGDGLHMEDAEVHFGTNTQSSAGNTDTIDLTAGNHWDQLLTSTTGAVTLTITEPSGEAAGTILLKADSTARDITWATTGTATVKWPEGEPNWSGGDLPASNYMLISFRFSVTEDFLILIAGTAFT